MVTMDWTRLADDDSVEKVVKALNERGIETTVVGTKDEALKKLLELLPEGAEIMEASSATLDEIGATKEIDESGRYRSLRKEIHKLSDPKLRNEFRRRSSGPEYGVGSVQAITEGGQVVAASATGSQLATYVYGASNVVWVVGTNKIVKNLEDAFKRIYEYALPLENERVKRAYGLQHSSVSKILIFEKERPNRIKLILVKEKLGF